MGHVVPLKDARLSSPNVVVGDPVSTMNVYYVYILASKKNGTLYIGVTSDLLKRVNEHKAKLVDGFTKKYDIQSLVFYEQYNDATVAIEREKTLKKWNRKWKIRLIEKMNPQWNDLYNEII